MYQIKSNFGEDLKWWALHLGGLSVSFQLLGSCALGFLEGPSYSPLVTGARDKASSYISPRKSLSGMKLCEA